MFFTTLELAEDNIKEQNFKISHLSCMYRTAINMDSLVFKVMELTPKMFFIAYDTVHEIKQK